MVTAAGCYMLRVYADCKPMQASRNWASHPGLQAPLNDCTSLLQGLFDCGRAKQLDGKPCTEWCWCLLSGLVD